MKNNTFKYFKFALTAAFSSAMIFSAAFGACATTVDVGSQGMNNVGTMKGVTTTSSDDTSGVNVKFAKFKSLFKTLNIRKAIPNSSFIDSVNNTESSINFQAYPALYIAEYVTGNTLAETGFKLGAKSQLAARHEKMCGLIDHVPAGTHSKAGGKTPSPLVDQLEDWNFYDWARAWSGNLGIMETMLSSTDFFYSFLDTAITPTGVSKAGYSAVIGTLAQNTGSNHWSLDLQSNTLTFKAEWSTFPEWQGLIGKGQTKSELIYWDAQCTSGDCHGALRHLSNSMWSIPGHVFAEDAIYRLGDMRYDSFANPSIAIPETERITQWPYDPSTWRGTDSPTSLRKHKLLEVAYLLCEAKQ